MLGSSESTRLVSLDRNLACLSSSLRTHTCEGDHYEGTHLSARLEESSRRNVTTCVGSIVCIPQSDGD